MREKTSCQYISLPRKDHTDLFFSTWSAIRFQVWLLFPGKKEMDSLSETCALSMDAYGSLPPDVARPNEMGGENVFLIFWWLLCSKVCLWVCWFGSLFCGVRVYSNWLFNVLLSVCCLESSFPSRFLSLRGGTPLFRAGAAFDERYAVRVIG